MTEGARQRAALLLAALERACPACGPSAARGQEFGAIPKPLDADLRRSVCDAGQPTAIRIRVVLALVALMVGSVVFIDLLDEFGIPRRTLLPAAPYAISILVAAYFLPPRMVALVTLVAMGAQLVVAWNHGTIGWSVALEQLALLFIGYLSTALAAKNVREAALKARAEVALARLQESEERFRLLATGSPDVMYYQDLDLRYTWIVNPAPPLAEEQVLGKTDLDLFRQEQAERLMEVKRKVLATGVGARIEVPCPASSGEGRCEIALQPRRDREGRIVGLAGYVRDITERKRAESLLLEQRQALAVMEERERVARELHDSLGQVLSFVNVEAQAARRLLSHGETADVDDYLARMIQAVREAHADVREYILGVRSGASVEQQFFSAVEQHVRGFGRFHGIATEVVIPPDMAPRPFDPAAEVQLLRIIQGALTNIRKHALARHVKVVFSVHGDLARVTIEDDGRGFAVDHLPDHAGGFGLQVLRARARSVGGNLEVHSAPGMGTRVLVDIPLRPRTERGNGESASG